MHIYLVIKKMNDRTIDLHTVFNEITLNFAHLQK